MNTFETILNQLLGPGIIDVAIIVAGVFFCMISIGVQTSKQVRKNTVYNAEIRKLREDIFHHFEKNFFL